MVGAGVGEVSGCFRGGHMVIRGGGDHLSTTKPWRENQVNYFLTQPNSWFEQCYSVI